MFNRLYLAFIITILGTVAHCFSRPHATTIRNHKKISEIERKQKIPLEDLISSIEKAQASGDLKIAMSLYRRICKDYKASDMAPNAYYLQGIYLENNRQFVEASKKFQKIIKIYPESKWFTQANEHIFQIAKKLQDGVRPCYFGGTIPGLRNDNLAIENFWLVKQYMRYSDLAQLALIERANLYLKTKQYFLAIKELEELIDLYPSSQKVPYAYLKIAEIHSNLVKGDEYNQGGSFAALHHYEDFCQLFPLHKEISFVNQRIKDLKEQIVRSIISMGEFYFDKLYNSKAAEILYSLAIHSFSDTLAAKTAQEKIQAIHNGDRPKATPIDFLFPSYKQPKDNGELTYDTINQNQDS